MQRWADEQGLPPRAEVGLDLLPRGGNERAAVQGEFPHLCLPGVPHPGHGPDRAGPGVLLHHQSGRLVPTRAPCGDGCAHPHGRPYPDDDPPNMVKLMEDVRQGTLDYALTKPEDAQLLVSVRESQIWQAVDVLVGTIVLVVAVLQLEGGIGVGEALAFAVALILGGLTIYCFWLILTTLTFWVVRIHETVELFEGVYQAGRWPVTVYPFALRLLLTFLVLLAVAITVPAQGITSRLTGQTLALAAAFTSLLVGATRWF